MIDLKKVYTLSCYNRSYEIFKNINTFITYFILNNNFTKFQNESVLFKNKYGFIKKYNFYDIDVVSKITDDKTKSEEHLHEYFVGIKCINNLLKDVPNFIYVYEMFFQDKSINIITEYIKGITLQEYILGDDFELNEYFLIIIQICLAIEIAQEKYCFMHCDLTPWNIMIKYYKTPVTVDYNINNKIYSITSNYIPIIIDYGKSHFIYKNLHYGIINAYNYTKYFDLFSLFITSVYEISINKNLNRYDYNLFQKYIKFLHSSKLCSTEFQNYKEIKSFLHFSKKYCNLINIINDYKHESRPLDLVNYILDITNIKIVVKDNFKNSMEFMPYTLINKLIYTDSIKDKLGIYLKYFRDIQTLDLTSLDDLLSIYILQKIFNHVQNVYEFLTVFIKKEINILKEIKKYKKIYENTLKYLNETFNSVNNKLNLHDIKYIHDIYDINMKNNYKIESYDENIFLFPEKIKHILNNINVVNKTDIKTDKTNIDLINILKYIVFNNSILQISEINKNILKKIISDYKGEHILLNNANFYTLKHISNLVIYKE